jgi:hypothetical protein
VTCVTWVPKGANHVDQIPLFRLSTKCKNPVMITTTGPYFDDSGRPVLRESVVVAADILGYKQAVQEASQDGKGGPFLEFLHYALKESFRNVDDLSGKEWFAKMLTDNLLVAIPPLNDSIGAREFIQASFSIGHFQREMIKYGLPVRGGICVGQIHVSDLLIFPANNILSDMDEAEKKASSPRIVLLDSAKMFLCENTPDFSEMDKEDMRYLLWEDSDGAEFVNYLRPLSRPFIRERHEEILAHKQFIEGRLKSFSRCERVHSKYIWLANYHNKFCRSASDFNSPKFIIEFEGLNCMIGSIIYTLIWVHG